MRILSLIENTSANEKLICEHGLSLYIEFNGKGYLMDAGQSGAFADNAKKLGVDLFKTDKVILSHNHYDHTGGLQRIFRMRPDIKVYAKKAFDNEYFKKNGLFVKELGMNRDFFEKHRMNFVLFNNFQEIDDGFYLASNEEENENFKCMDKQLMMKKDGKAVRDDFAHECFAVIFPDKDRRKGCVVISSCSHCGIINILRTVKRRWNVPIIAVIGGFHIMGSSTKALNCSDQYIRDMADELSDLCNGSIYTCHCTGIKGYEALKEYLRDQIQYLQTGEELEF